MLILSPKTAHKPTNLFTKGLSTSSLFSTILAYSSNLDRYTYEITNRYKKSLANTSHHHIGSIKAIQTVDSWYAKFMKYLL